MSAAWLLLLHIAASPADGNYSVRRGDTLSDLARRYYGNRAYAGLIAVHNHRESTAALPVGCTLELPDLYEMLERERLPQAVRAYATVVLRARDAYASVEEEVRAAASKPISPSTKQNLDQAAAMLSSAGEGFERLKISGRIARQFHAAAKMLRQLSAGEWQRMEGAGLGWSYETDQVHQHYGSRAAVLDGMDAKGSRECGAGALKCATPSKGHAKENAMLPVLLLALQAAPVNVIAVRASKPSTGAALNKALVGTTVVDESELHAYLFPATGLMPMQDFNAFTAPPAAGWPSALAADWKNGVAHCLKTVGPPPWRDDFAAAMTCSQRLSKFLWEKLLRHRGASAVFILNAFENGPRTRATVHGQTYAVSGDTVLSSDEEVPSAEWDAAVDRVVTALVKGTGKPSHRDVVTELSSPVTDVDPWATDVKLHNPVDLKKTCDALPAKLVFNPPEGVLASTLADRWAASVKSQGAPLQCALHFAEHAETNALLGTSIHVVSTTLDCGKTQVRAEIGKDIPGVDVPQLRGRSVALISEKLLQALAGKLCAPGAPTL